MSTTQQQHPISFSSTCGVNANSDASVQKANGSAHLSSVLGSTPFNDKKVALSPNAIGITGKGHKDPLSQPSKDQQSVNESHVAPEQQDSLEERVLPSYSLLSNQPVPEVTLSNNLERGVHSNSQWTLNSLQDLKKEFLQLYEISRAKQTQWKKDLDTLDSCDSSLAEPPSKKRKLNDSSVQKTPQRWRFANHVRRCGFVNAKGVRCKRAGVCPFHGADGKSVLRKKRDRDLDMLILAASLLEKNPQAHQSTNATQKANAS